ncbi:DNA cytosine methyltransferase [Natrinema ejinorense]|uniref:DNA (Cytosine-5-)-methyltransferase n=1 Tax=Natrinema ejinorense TaxID=373386 RepID=A0A2A5QS42_9EURY|nr:DNA (cytosine-5-)-methyltransferase [Natrinema ejinorense]PCR89660.1 DNA (cytosine-5-)-methyltransferase [Natrinema ejinorense]
MTDYKFVDLFAGIGGTRAAFSQVNGYEGECVFSCEISEEAQDAYERNWGEPITEHDIRDVDADAVPDHDVLLACWPCPSFSQMGKQDGLEDERGMLFFEIVDILKKKQPKAFLLENVKNLRSVNDGSAFQTVESHLSAAGYQVSDEVLNALDFGLPQHRERLILVGFREDIARAMDSFEIPTQNGNPLDTEEKQRAALAELLEDDPDDRYEASEKIKQDRRESVEDPDAIPEPSVWHENRNGGIKPRPYSSALRASSSWNYILINGERHPTVSEMLRLQGFPKWFKIDDSNRSRARRLTGNTVPVPMIREPAAALLDEI